MPGYGSSGYPIQDAAEKQFEDDRITAAVNQPGKKATDRISKPQ
jgi:hypothetical protein